MTSGFRCTSTSATAVDAPASVPALWPWLGRRCASTRSGAVVPTATSAKEMWPRWWPLARTGIRIRMFGRPAFYSRRAPFAKLFREKRRMYCRGSSVRCRTLLIPRTWMAHAAHRASRPRTSSEWLRGVANAAVAKAERPPFGAYGRPMRHATTLLLVGRRVTPIRRPRIPRQASSGCNALSHTPQLGARHTARQGPWKTNGRGAARVAWSS